MLKPQLSMIEGECLAAPATALVPVERAAEHPVVEPSLAARLQRVAESHGKSCPHVIPGACVLVLALHLPLKTDRKRRDAALFAMEPYLAVPFDSVVVAVGQHLGDDLWLCAAADPSVVDGNHAHHGPVLPDILAVPLPEDPDAWCLWIGERTAYLRTADGAGHSLSIEVLPDLWRGQGRPAIELVHGVAPAGIDITRRRDPPPDSDPEVLQLDLGLMPKSRHAPTVRRWAIFAAAVAVFTALGHSALLYGDARALEGLAAERERRVLAQLDVRDVALDLSMSLDVLAAELATLGGREKASDPFMALLSKVASALGPNTDTRFRELRFDSDTGQITVLMSAPDLDALQIIETRLVSAGLGVVAGAATRSSNGAERQLVIGAS